MDNFISKDQVEISSDLRDIEKPVKNILCLFSFPLVVELLKILSSD